jgi:hypothetical protein
MMSDSDISVFDMLELEEGLELLKKKLLEGWVYIVGEHPCLMILEDIVYPPRTEKNRDFWFAFIRTTGKVITFFLGKKTEELRKFLGISREKFEKLIGIEERYDPSNQMCIHDLVFYEGDREECINIFVNNFRKFIDEVREAKI